MEQVDLQTLSVRESDQIEWKENVADTDDVVATLAAFANDWSNLGGGYVVCCAREEKDEHAFKIFGAPPRSQRMPSCSKASKQTWISWNN